MSDACTRVIVKNLPKDVGENELRTLFSQKKCTITDLKLIRTPQGQSRRFAFIGFENAQETQEAISYFNNTFIGTIRIAVEPVSSSHTPNPSRKLQYVEAPKKESANDKRQRLLSVFSEEDKNDPLLRSFLEVMKPRNKGTTWSNDDDAPVTAKQSDDEYEEWDPANRAADTKEEENSLESIPAEGEHETEDIKKKIMDTGRLFLRSLSFTCKSSDLEQLFASFGPVSEVLLPLTIDTHRPKGYGFVQFVLPEHAFSAYKALHNSLFQGRRLWIGPAEERSPLSAGGDGLSFKQKKRENEKIMAVKGKEPERRLHSLFLSTDAVMDAVSAHLGISKRSLLMDPDAASKIAIAETFIIEQTEAFLRQHNIADVSMSGSEDRSHTMILIKNIPFIDEDVLKSFIDGIGGVVSSGLVRLLMPPTKTLAIGEWINEDAAKAAFKALAYRRFRSAPLYVQWAPVGILPKSESTVDEKVTPLPAEMQIDLTKPEIKSEPSKESSTTTSLFVKNLNFNTSSEALLSALRSFLAPLQIQLTSAHVCFRRDAKKGLLSAGYGFVSFPSNAAALEALDALQSSLVVDGHRLQFSLSNEKHSKDTAQDSAGGTTILVKNVAFEATAADLRKLFSPFGQVKRIRLPKKPSKGHRGFAFVEFVTRPDAEEALHALRHTHLYGRHLVLQWAASDESEIESKLKASLEKQAASFAKTSARNTSTGTKIDNNTNGGDEDHDDDDDEELEELLFDLS